MELKYPKVHDENIEIQLQLFLVLQHFTQASSSEIIEACLSVFTTQLLLNT